MKRGVRTIIAGGMLLTVGVIAVPVAVIPLVISASKAQPVQFKVPGGTEIIVKEPGRYYVWNDFSTIYNGKSYQQSEALPGGITIKVRDESGTPLPLLSNFSATMSTTAVSRNSVGCVEITQPGKVSITVSGGTEERVFSFGPLALLREVFLILGGIAVSGIVALTGIAMLVWGIVKLVRTNRVA